MNRVVNSFVEMTGAERNHLYYWNRVQEPDSSPKWFASYMIWMAPGIEPDEPTILAVGLGTPEPPKRKRKQDFLLYGVEFNCSLSVLWE